MKRAKSTRRTLQSVLVLTILVSLSALALVPATAVAYDDYLPEQEFERNLPGDPDTPSGISAHHQQCIEESSNVSTSSIVQVLVAILGLVL